MNQDRFNTIDSLLEDVIDLPTLDREDILNERCQGDISLKSEVLELLDSLKNDDDFIENSKLSNIGDFFDEETQNDFIGERVGAYRLKELIGTGGMSVVYLASRIDDFEKEVAVKIIPPLDNRQRLADNFLRERQILANLSHPYIAQILDGGTTTDGKPYLVMEYVDGVPLDEFCETNDLSETEILELFQKVCKTVTFAHTNFIVHRDLKPQNILITKDGTPKLLDFGIAKLLDNENSLFADNKTFDGNALTLEYASPEQITGGNITAASDVYSLGVILYKLLTGKKPHDLRDKSLAEIVETVTTSEPIVPSQINGSESKIAKSELDFIALQALANSPKERYRSVEEFEQDIENYLNNLPISARPATTLYRLNKYVRRRRLELAVASILVLILLGWLVTSIIQVQTSREIARKNRQSAYSAEMTLASKEYENANLTKVKELVNKYIPQNGEEDIRGFEWYFLNNLANPIGNLKTLNHPDEIWGIAFSPDGKLVASAANDNIVRIWNAEEETIVTEVEQEGAWKVAFFPDGKKFAVASSSKKNPVVKIYETTSGREIHTLRGHTKRVRAVAVSPDGKSIASGSYDGEVIFWNAEDGTKIKRFDIPVNVVYAKHIRDVAFSPDGGKLAVTGKGIFSVIDTKTWTLEQTSDEIIKNRNFDIDRWKVGFSPTEKLIAVSTSLGTIYFIDTETLKVLRQVKIHNLNIKSFVFTNDGKTLITASWDRTIKFVNIEKALVVNEILGHFGGVHDIALSTDGKIFATASADFTARLWDINKTLQNSAFLDFRDASDYDEKGNNIYASTAETVRKINLDSRKVIWEQNINYRDSSLDFSPATNRVIIAGTDSIVFLLDANNGEVLKGEKVIDSAINSIKFSSDGQQIYVGYLDGYLRVLETETYKEVYKKKVHTGFFKGLAVSSDGKLIATGGNDNLVKIIDAESGRVLHSLSGNTKPLNQVAFSPDDKMLIATGADEIARVWRVSDGELLQKINVMSGYSVAFSPDGKRLATGSSIGIIRIWNTETWQEVLAISTKQKLIGKLFFSADSKKLISIDERLKIWNGD